uniref:Uncharacterized protein n=1 Tax=Caenorhabditis tropicalis TaxID=1561998 RepID=A0A1I7UCM0_9PELO
MRIVFFFLFCIFTLKADDSYDEVKAKIQELIDGGFGKNGGGRGNQYSENGVGSEDSGKDGKQREMRSLNWPDDDDDFFGSSGGFDRFYGNRNEDSKRKSPKEDGKFIDKVSKKLKSIPGKVASGAAILTGKVVDGVISIPGKVVDGVKSIPSAAKSVLPGGNKKKGDITLNDYTQNSNEQENHYHLHKDKHYHEKEHRHQDDSSNLNVYNNWDGDELDKEYGKIYGNLRYKRSIPDSVDRIPQNKLRKEKNKSERKAIIVF